ncbi:hypothetical protein Dimus_035550, partial [Dionaea muscipula]
AAAAAGMRAVTRSKNRRRAAAHGWALFARPGHCHACAAAAAAATEPAAVHRRFARRPSRRCCRSHHPPRISLLPPWMHAPLRGHVHVINH